MDATELTRTLAALEDGELRARKAAAVLSGGAPEEAVALLSAVVHMACRRSDPSSAALEGILRAVRLHLDDDGRQRLLLAAEAASDLAVQAILTRSEPVRSFDRDREQWVDREMQSRTLGHRRQLARTHDRDLLVRLAGDQDPLVLRQLLMNPRCTEREVLIAASRRPVRAEVLEEVFRSRRWGTNRRVRRALAMNPYSPPALATAALALLTAPDLREVVAYATLSSEVRAQAVRLLASHDGESAAG
jgi:hypothetical protein